MCRTSLSCWEKGGLFLRVLDYFQPATVDEAVRCLSRSPNTTKVLAGGTDLIIQLRERVVEPEYILDLGYINELREIVETDNSVVIGSMATFTTIENNPLVRAHLPMLAKAAGSVGSPQIRNSGTIGGNLANAATAADTVPALLALEAKAVLASGHGKREVAVAELLAGINKTNIASDEILISLIVPIPTGSTYGTFVKLGRRKALAIARLNLGLTVSLQDSGSIGKVTLALGAVGTTAYRVAEVEEYLCGQAPTPELFEAAGELVSSVVARKLGDRPTASYKKAIAKAALKRGLVQIGTECGRW